LYRYVLVREWYERYELVRCDVRCPGLRTRYELFGSSSVYLTVKFYCRALWGWGVCYEACFLMHPPMGVLNLRATL
jgi:hypothetical protein